MKSRSVSIAPPYGRRSDAVSSTTRFQDRLPFQDAIQPGRGVAVLPFRHPTTRGSDRRSRFW